jgi:hypothetical protein
MIGAALHALNREAVQDFLQKRLQDLYVAQSLAVEAYDRRSMPALDALPRDVVLTVVGTWVLAYLLVVVIFSGKVRKFIFDVVETVVASALILLLIGIILGLPIGEQRCAFSWPSVREAQGLHCDCCLIPVSVSSQQLPPPPQTTVCHRHRLPLLEGGTVHCEEHPRSPCHCRPSKGCSWQAIIHYSE